MTDIEDLERDHDHRVTAIQGRFGARVRIAQKGVDDAQRQWDAIFAEEDRLPRYAAPWLYWAIMVILAVLEAPLNRLSFELFFTESPIWSFAVALMCGAMLIGLAHFLGLAICRYRYNKRKAERDTGRQGAGGGLLLQFLALVALILLICYGIALLRQGYLLFVTQGDPSFADALASQNYSEAADLVLGVGLRVEGVVFFAINLGVVCLGVIAAMVCHDPHPNFQEVDETLKASQRAHAFHERVLADMLAKEERRYAAEELKLSRRAGAQLRALPQPRHDAR